MNKMQTYQVKLVKVGRVSEHTISCADDMRKDLQDYFHGIDREHFVVVALDTQPLCSL